MFSVSLRGVEMLGADMGGLQCVGLGGGGALRFWGRVLNRGYMISMRSISYCGHQIRWVFEFHFGLKVMVYH